MAMVFTKDKTGSGIRTGRHCIAVGLCVLGLLCAMPTMGQQRAKRSQQPEEIRSGRSGVTYGGTRTSRNTGSEYGHKRFNNNLFGDEQSGMGAWAVGIIAGASMNWQTRDAGYAYDMRYRGAWGAVTGVSVTYEALPWLGVRADVQFAQKDYIMERMQATMHTNNVHTRSTNYYLQVPLLADWTFGTLVKSHIYTGAYAAGWLGGVREGVQAFDFQKMRNSYSFTPDDNRFEAGIAAGVGVTYDVLPYLRVGAEAMLYYSLTSTMKKQVYMNYPRYNNTVTLEAKVAYIF